MKSIYEFLNQNTDENGYVKDGCVSLPDAGDMNLSEGEVWVPGAYEGILLRSDFAIRQYSIVNFQISRVIKRHMKNPSDKNFEKLCKTLFKYAAISIADPVLSFLATSDKEKMRNTALEIIHRTDKREVLKMGIALLGESGKEEDADILKVLGSHEEFALYAVVAAKNILKDANSFILELLEHLNGWGKISAVYELDYDKEESRFYVLTKGCKNSIGLSYLSNVCAIKGKMANALEKALENNENVNELYLGACDIFTGLLEMHPRNDTISEYPDAERAAKAFYRIVTEKNLSTRDERENEIIAKLREYMYLQR